MATTLLADVVVKHCHCGTTLVDLPSELLIAICVLVTCPTNVWCRLVCRRLRDVIDGSLELQYQIELARDGMTDAHYCPSSRASSHFKLHSQPHTPSESPFHAGLKAPRARRPDAASLVPSRGATLPARAVGGPRHPGGPTPQPFPVQTTAERLARLRELRRAWTTLGWTRCVTVPMPGLCCAYELVGGMFCKTQPGVQTGTVGGWDGGHGGDDEGEVEVEVEGQGGAQAEWGEGEDADGLPAHGSRTMSLTWLPGPQAHNRARTLVRDDLGIPTRDFAVDPSQDLMVLFKSGDDAGLPMVVVYPGMLELHVRTMSMNRTHPEAGVPVLSTPVLYPVTSVFVQIVDDVVGMMYCVDPARPQITIWNWKTGRLVVDRTSANLPPGTWDFSFVHSRALFVTTTDGNGSIELFTFTCDAADANANVNANDYAGADADTLVHVASLHLPPVLPSVRVLSVSTHTGPFLAACPPSAAFVSTNEERIHILTVQYVHLMTLEGPRTRPRVGMVVHQRGLERYLDKGAASTCTGAPASVPWSEWGRTDARVLPHVGMFQWLRYVHGQRFVMLHPSAKAGKSTLLVLDFNVRRAFDDHDDVDAGEDDTDHAGRKVTRHDGTTGKEGDDPDASLSKTILERIDYLTYVVMPNVFVDAVESGLPYHEARRDIRGDYSGMMIDDERLVGLKYPAFLTGDMKGIDVFTM